MSTYTHRNHHAGKAGPMNLARRIGRRTETNTATVRGYIPAKIEPHDTTREIVEVFGVSYGTACVWLRILRGPVKRN